MKRRAWIAAAIVAGVLLAVPDAGVISFEEIAARSGLVFTADSCPTPNKNQPETMVAGVALLDYDNDGYLDVYLVNGAAIPSLKKDSPRYWNRLFHNNRDGTFTDVTETAGVAGEGYGMGVAVGDFDNDGWPDLYLANVTGNQLFRNNRVHFGMGASQTIREIDIRWPSRIHQVLHDVAADQILTVQEPAK